jgi:proteasome lid subunit RPN8/RPN11
VGKDEQKKPASPSESGAKSGAAGEVRVTGGEWKELKNVVRRKFPGPAEAEAALRVAATREAYAELFAHAKQSLEKEICGVLVGEVCEDDCGVFVTVQAVIRGTAARQKGTHVTYTDEAWTEIHKEKDARYPRLSIVGWYHSHPGFGVQYSDLDRFIQKSYFSAPAQLGWVVDPLGGEEALYINTGGEIAALERFWVDGKERRGTVKKSEAGGATGAGVASPQAVERLEARVSQLTGALDDLRAGLHRFLLFVGMVVCLGVILVVGYNTYRSAVSERETPKLRDFVPVPVRIGDKNVYLGVGVVEWKIPPELNAAHIQLEERRREEEARKKKEEDERKADEKAPATTETGKGTGT